jgi:hypothetical protein
VSLVGRLRLVVIELLADDEGLAELGLGVVECLLEGRCLRIAELGLGEADFLVGGPERVIGGDACLPRSSWAARSLYTAWLARPRRNQKPIPASTTRTMSTMSQMEMPPPPAPPPSPVLPLSPVSPVFPVSVVTPRPVETATVAPMAAAHQSLVFSAGRMYVSTRESCSEAPILPFSVSPV